MSPGFKFKSSFYCGTGNIFKKVAHAVGDLPVKDLFSTTNTCGIGFLSARKLKY